MTDARQIFKLELPYCFIEEFNKLYKFRYSKPELNAQYLFTNEKNNMIVNGIVNELLKKIRKEFQEDNKVEFEKNPFTPTGLQKYSIIQMILAGVNQTIITEFTGQKEDILFDCQLEVNKNNIIERTRYVNYKIRSLATYDEMQ